MILFQRGRELTSGMLVTDELDASCGFAFYMSHAIFYIKIFNYRTTGRVEFTFL